MNGKGEIYACDIETTGLDFNSDDIIGLGVFGEGEQCFYNNLSDIREWLREHNNSNLIWHNGKFDRKFIYAKLGIWPQNSFDTMLAAYLEAERPNRLGLGALVEHYLGLPSWKEKGFVSNLKYADIEAVASYCLTDCEYTYKLYEILLIKLIEQDSFKFYDNYFLKANDLLAKMEVQGVCVDITQFKEIRSELIKEISTYENSLYAAYKDILVEHEDAAIDKHYEGKKTQPDDDKRQQLRAGKFRFNFGSPAQRVWLLKDKLGFPCEKVTYERGQKKIKISAGKDVIEEYKDSHPIVRELLELESKKTEEGYVHSYIEFTRHDNRIHSNFNLCSTDTGRLSSTEPNLQNVKKGRLRDPFIAKDGRVLVVCDLAQIEPRIAAYFSQDEALLNTFISGIDFYGVVANRVLRLGLDENILTKKYMKERYPNERSFGKVAGLAIAYGQGPGLLADSIEKETGKRPSYPEAKRYIEAYWKGLPGLHRLRVEAYQEVLNRRYINTLFGRRVYLSEDKARHLGLNYKVQGSASDYCLYSQLWVQQEIKNYEVDAKLELIVHDEVVYEVDPDHADNFKLLLETVMCNGLKRFHPEINFNLPLEVDISIGKSWSCKE
jgi:DNA polymerase-1